MKKDYPTLSDADRRDRYEELVRAASGRWGEIINALSVVDISQTIDACPRAKHIRCHKGHGNTNDQFRVFGDFEHTGGGVCNTCGTFANGFALLTYLNDWPFRDAVREVAQYLEGRGINTTSTVAVPAKPAKKQWSVTQDALDKLHTVWGGSRPIANTAAERYLRHRHLTCDLPDPQELRFHDSLMYWDDDNDCSGGYHPAMVALLRTAQSGQAVTVHRTYLDDDGQKAKVRKVKKLMRCAIDGAISALGAAIRLYPANGPVLSVCEGIETALAVRSAHPDVPVWACYSASVLSRFTPPAGIDRVLIWGDLDPKGAGQLAAAKLALHLEAMGIEATVLIPWEPVYVPPAKSNGWYNADHGRSAIVDCLQRNGYTVASEANLISFDWHDAWVEQPDRIKHALSRSAHQCA